MAAASPIVLSLVGALAGTGVAQGQSVNLGGVNNIVADGRTQTNVTVDGNRTSITTGSVLNGTGFNSFWDFQQAAGTRVDLYVPDGAGNLLNIVRNGPVVINGLLNSYKDGAIGGNVFFSDSHGFVVGAGGVVNVGSLTVNTPTARFLGSVIRADGSIDQGAADRLMRGEIPISRDGLISISGIVNATGGITLQGRNVSITGGGVRFDGAGLDQRALFDASVNTNGLVEGGALVVRGGTVSIVATGKARIGGSIDVSAADSGAGGTVSVKSGGGILVDGAARFTADGAGSGAGGTIALIADDTISAADGATFTARATGGDGGFVELSGKTAIVGAINVGLGSAGGKAGTLLFDPWDLYIGGTHSDGGADDSHSVAGSILSGGANVVLQATNSITVTAGGIIDTRQQSGGVSTGNSGDITLEAPLITIADGAYLRADVSSGSSFAAGDILLKSDATPSLLSSTATAAIVIGTGGGAAPVISGRNISFLATAAVDSGLLLLDLPTAHATIAVNTSTITASGAFRAEATATTNSGLASLPLGIVVTDVLSSVKIAGAADITAASATLKATASATAKIATASLAPADSTADGAVAISTVTSKAIVDIAGSAHLAIAGALDLAARNDVISSADATPQAAQFGASVAVSVIDAETSATIGGNAQISAGSLGLDARTTTAVTVTAKAAAGGAGEPQDGSETKTQLDKYGDEASTSDGKVSVVGGFAVSDLTSTTLARLASAAAATVAGATSVTTQSANSAVVVADGSAVESTTGVGVAVGINLAHVSNDALVAQGLATGSLAVSAGMALPAGNVFTTTATSGAGAKDVGVAGSLAVNLVDTQSSARIGTGVAITVAGGGAVSLTATNQSKSSAKAVPMEAGATGDTVGVGVSAAINIVANRATAEIADNATLTGAGALTLSASGLFAVESEAKAGSEGGISVTPALALSLVSNTTTARLGALTAGAQGAGSVALSAVQQSTVTTKASAKAKGNKVAIGAALALALVNDAASATTARNIAATGAVTFTAMGASFSELTAEASASGGKPAKEDGTADANAGDKDVDGQVDDQLTVAKTKQDGAGIGDADQKDKTDADVANKDARSASTSEGGVSVAAAIGVNVQTATVTAAVPDGVAITSGGALTIRSAANTDGKITADGSAVGAEGSQEASIGIGAAVAVNKVSATNVARLGVAAHSVGGLTIEALKTDIAAKLANAASTATRADVYLTSATSGAGASNVGVAGSLALNLIDTESSARIAGGAAVAVTGGGAVSLNADDRSGITAKALPVEAGASGGKVGVGVSAAINIVANRSVAEVQNSATVTGAGALTLSASGLFAVEAEAKAGSKGGVSITPALGLNLVNNTTTAQLGSGGTLTAGSVSLAAVQQSAVTTTASAKAAGSDVAIGAALALALVNDTATATTARNVSATGTVTFVAMGASLSTLTAEASASGAKAAKDDGAADGEKDVDGKVDDQLDSAKTKQDKSGVGDADQKGKTNADVNDKAGRSASTSEGGVSVAAAVGVNVQTATVTAAVPDGVAITSGGALTIRSAANTDGKITADGSAVGTEGAPQASVGIGAAVAVNKVSATNAARLGVAAHSAGGLTIEALKLDVAAQVADPASTATRADVYLAKATSGAGASNVGVAGSLALNLVDTESSARIAGGTAVAVTGGGAVSLKADDRAGITATALPADAGVTGGKVGVGVSAAINVVANRAIAEVADGAALTGTGARTLSANGLFTAEAEAKAGSKGGVSITPALGLNLVNNTTTARIGTGGTLSAGSVSLAAVQQSTVTTKASAKAAGEDVAIGAALALALVNDTVTATTARSIATTGAVSFTAQGKSSGELSAEAGAAGAKAAKDDGTADGEKDVDGKVDDQLASATDKQDKAGVGDADQKSKTDTDVNGTDGKAKRSAKTDEGKVSVAAAVAVNVTDSTVSAVVPDGVAISAGGSLSVASANTTSGKITADGSASKAEVAIGVAVAVNVVEKTNTALLGNAVHAANGVTVAATQFGDPANPDADAYEATATSGAGGSKIGIAGSLALNLITAQASAQIATGASVNAGTGASAITADQRITAKASALPTATGGASGGKVGIGASVALNLITDTTTAALSDGAAFTGGASLAVGADSALSTTTKAEAGAAGGVAVDAVVALAMINQATTAKIGTSSTGLSVSGAVSVSATGGGDHAASADGNVKAGNVGVGAAAAVIIGGGDKVGLLANTSVTSASLARNVTAASLAISAGAVRTYVAEASATAGGGKSDSADSDKPPEKPATSTKTLDDTKDYQKGNDAADEQSKGKTESTGSGGSGAKVQVAAAVGVAVSQDVVTAGIASGVTVSAAGQVAVTASNTVDMATVGSGQAGQFGGTSQAQVGVGVGVALGINTSTTAATIGDGAHITQAGSVSVAATTRENVSDAFKDRLTARAVAGASSSKVSVAGALAAGISLTTGKASVGDNVVIASSGAVSIATDNKSQLSAKALAGSYTSGNAAIGASIATVYSERNLAAAIGNGATITGTNVSVTAVSQKVNVPPTWLAGLLNVDDFDLGDLKEKFETLEGDLKTKPLLGQSNYYAEAIGGAAAPSGVAVQGSFAVMVFDDAVSATIGKSLTNPALSAATTVNATGAVTLDARNDFAAKAMSGGVAVGNSVGVGVSASVIVSSGTTLALLADKASVNITGAGAFNDKATASQDILTLGLAAGAASTAGIAGVANVVVSENDVEALVGAGASVKTGGSATVAAQNDLKTFGVGAGVGAGGTAGVGGGASVVVVNNVTRAALADGTSSGNAVNIDAAGAFGISAKASETGVAITAAGAGGGTAGVAVGAAVYVLGTTTEALAGNYARIGQTNAPSSLTISAEDETDLTTVAGSLGIGGTAGIGAGAAVGVVSKTVTAAIGSNANVRAGDVRLSAKSTETALTTAIGFGVGGTAGIAGAVAVYSVSDTTTARIGTGAAVLATNSVAVLGSDDTDIVFISGSAAGGGVAGVGASAAVAVVGNATSATIDDNASVTALAQGGSVQYVTGYAPALGAGAGDFAAPTPDDYGYDAGGSDGEVLTAAEAQRQGLRLLALTRDAAPVTASASGVVVNATGETAVRSLAVGGAAAGVAGISISANVPVITTSIVAGIGTGAKINVDNNGGAGANQSVVVAAAGDVYRAGLAGAIGGGGAVGLGAGVDTAIISPTVIASIDATVNARRDVLVSARGREDFVGAAAAAGAGGTVGLAGGVSVVSLDAETRATIGSHARIDADGNVAVVAEDITRTSILAGSLGIGVTGGGVGGSLGLTLLTKRTEAEIAAAAEVTARGNSGDMTVYDGGSFSGTRTARGVLVYANSNESLFTLDVAGGGGLFAGVAGAVSIQLLDVATTAAIGNNAKINDVNTGANAAQDVVVLARDSTSIAAIDGGLAVGAVGIAGAVDVGVLRNTTSASVGDGATVKAARRVDVAALQNVDVNSTVVSAAGGIVGIAAGVSVYAIGDGIDPDSEGSQQISGEDDEGNNREVGGYAQGQLDDGTVDDVLGSSEDDRVRNIGTSVAAARSAVTVNTGLSVPAGTSASLGSASVTAGGAITVQSLDKVGAKTTAGAVAGGLAGLGAGIGVVTVESTNTAQVAGTSTLSGASLKVDANSTHTLAVNGVAGSLGLAVAAQASLALITDNSNTRALLAGVTVSTPGAVLVNATATRTGTADARGAAVAGTAAIGISYAAVNLGGSVGASLGQSGGHGATIGTSGARAASLTVTATSQNTADATTQAASGGIGLAALGALAEAHTTTAVDTLADNATVYSSGAVLVQGEARGRAGADAKGLALAGLVAVGGSVADARVAEAVNTRIRGGSLIDAGSVTLAANVAPNTATPAVSASAAGSSGAFVGVTATEATATNDSQAKVLAERSTLHATGAVLVQALSTTSQKANATGLAGGVIAVGANLSRAQSNTVTEARLSDLVGVDAGSLKVAATGSDSNTADATSGSGGVVAGSAAEATTVSTSTTRALAETSAASAKYLISAIGGTVEIAASHTATFGGKVDSTQASLAGASGASLSHTVASTVDAGLGDYAYARAANLTVAAKNLVHSYFIGEPGFGLYPGATAKSNFNSDDADWNVDSGSGGLVNLPAGSSIANLVQTTSATIGSHADVHLLPPPGTGLSSLAMEAYNETIAHQKVKLDSGGAIATADTNTTILPTATAAVSIGALGDVIVDIGDIALAAWGNADLEARSAATTYGLAGAPSGKAYAVYTGFNNVNIGENVRLEASDGLNPTDGSAPTHGTIGINAGAGLDGRLAALRLRTTVDLFNKTAIPISTVPDAVSTVFSNANVVIGADPLTYPDPAATYGVNAAGDITVRASRGDVTVSAVGIGKDIYRETLAAAASAVSNLFGGGDVTFDYHGGTTSIAGEGKVTVNGLIDTGLRRHQTLTLNYDPACDVTTAACVVASGEIVADVNGPFAVGTDILERVRELRELLAQYNDDPVAKGAYQSEIRFLEKKLVALGLGTFNASGDFVPGDYAGPSPKEQALAQVAQNQQDISTAKGALAGATGTVVVADTVEWGTQILGAYTDTTFGLTANANTVKTTITQLTKYGTLTTPTIANPNAPPATIPNPQYSQAFVDQYNSISGILSAGEAAANQVDALTANNATRQATIDAKTLEIQNAQTALAQALIAGNTTAAATAQGQIATAQSAIGDELTAIASNNANIATQSAIAKSKAQDLKSALDSLVATARTSGNGGDDMKVAALDGASGGRTRIANSINGVDQDVGEPGSPVIVHVAGIVGLDTSLQGFVTSAATNIATLKGMGATSLAGYVTQLATLTTSLVTNTQTAATASSSSGTPTAYAIDVSDTLARLGNISIVADRLIGSSTGSLQAPGDAKIVITNNTANTLRLGNLTIPSYDAGRVRFNGVLVGSNADINKLNPGGAGASFGSVITSANSSRPLVSIVSNYNGDSLLYYNPSSPLSYLKTAHIAPDIILKSGKTIDNLTGAVNITSAAGNIYVQGTINAGSVSILAKNGDFVSSYVNGFDHIGGDPASFNSPTRAGEAGKGITANGAISIAARYININSTIQSGIADWTLNLNGTPTLTTTDPGSIGVFQTTIDQKIHDYQVALTAATGSDDTPSPIIELDGGVILNMGPAGLTASEAGALKTAIGNYIAAVLTTPSTSPLATLTIGGVSQTINLKDYISGDITGRLEFSIDTANAYAAAHPTSSGVYGVVNPSSNIGVAYDARNVRYVVDGTSVRGGYIQLYGQIMNTAGSGGQLNVLDGFGTITITNTSTIPVVLQALSAGDDPTGTRRGTAGMIDIMDVTGVNTANPASPVVSIKHTVYTRDFDPTSGSAGAIKIVTENGTIDNSTGDFVGSGSITTTAGGNRTATYNPTANQRYVWTTGEYFDNLTNFSVKQDQLFGSSSLTISSTTVFNSVDGPHTLNTYRLRDGTYVTVDVTQVGNAGIIQTNQGIVLAANPQTQDNQSLSGTDLVTSTYAYMNSQDGPTETGRRRDCNWWTLCIASKVTINYKIDQKYTVINTNSLKADNPIAVNFIGSDTGGITVTSNTDIVLTGNVTAANGQVKIEAKTGTSSIVEGNLAAEVRGKDVVLNAAGSVGGLTWAGDPAAPIKAAVAVNLTGGGALAANAGNGVVSITSRGDLVVSQVTAAGDVLAGKGAVNLVAAGSILGKDGSAKVQAPRVSLTALNGAIGSTANGQQLLVNTGFSADPSLRRFGDPALDITLDPNPYLGLTALAGGDIGIRSEAWSGNADGTMLVDKAISIGGDVRLASTGRILDNNPVEIIDSRTYDQLLSYWNSLGLLEGTENAAKQQAAVKAFENSTTQSYEQYWQIRRSQPDGGAVYDPAFSYAVAPGTAQYAALSRQFDADVRAANPSFDDAQVAAAVVDKIHDFEAAQTSLYHDLNGTVGSLTATYTAGYHYAASDDEKAALTKGAVWTERELVFSLSPGALKTITATNPVIKDPNVAGRTVTIEAQKGVGETIGAGTANVGVSIAADLDPRDLTIAQKVALASAERSDLELVVIHDGATVHIPLGKDYADLTPQQQAALDAAAAHTIPAADMTIVVLSKRPLNFSAPTALNVTVTDSPTAALDSGTAYLASRTSALLGAISVKGETRIKTIGSIGNAASGAVSTGNLILESAQGGIGSSGTPLAVSLLPNATFTARAQNGVFVNLTGDAHIDTVYSPQNVGLKATGALLNANNDFLINILGTNVVLQATAIGTNTQALNVSNNIGGGITASAAGLINLYGPANNLFVLKSVVSSGASITLTAGFEGIIDGAVTAPGKISLAAGDRFVISGVGQVKSTAGMIDVRAASLKMIDGAAMTADVDRVYIETTGDALVTGVESGSSDVKAVEIVAGGRVFAGNASGRAFDIKAVAAGAGVSVTAAQGIGDKTQANAKWQDGTGDLPGSANAVTDVPNPLRILTGDMTLAATAGDIRVRALAATAAAAATAGGGSIYLTADGIFRGTLLTAEKGNVNVEAEGNLTLDEVLAGTDPAATTGQVSARSLAGKLTLGTITSGGTQTFEAPGDVTFTKLMTTGLTGDVGDVHVASTAGKIHGVLINALKGDVGAEAQGDLTLDEVLAGTDPAAATGQVTARSLAGALTLGTITSGGTQTFEAPGDVTFTKLTTTGLTGDIGDVHATSSAGVILGGDIFAHGSIYLSGQGAPFSGKGVTFGTVESGVDSEITAAGDIIGDAQIAGGTVTDTAGGDILIRLIRGARMNFDAGGLLRLTNLEVGEEAVLRAGTLEAGIKQVPPGPPPLKLTLTGSKGTVGDFAHVTVDAPAGLILPELLFTDSEIETTARFVSILRAYVPGSMVLTTPLQKLLADNRSPYPRSGNNVQMYQPTFAFRLDLSDFHTTTNAFVVKYDASAQVTDLLNGLPFDGASLVRDTIRAMHHPDWLAGPPFPGTDPSAYEIIFDEDENVVIINGVALPVATSGNGPAVQIGALNP